jgi:hypothetical protein
MLRAGALQAKLWGSHCLVPPELCILALSMQFGASSCPLGGPVRRPDNSIVLLSWATLVYSHVEGWGH